MFKKLFLTALVISSFLFATACPIKKADLAKMKKFSGQIAAGAFEAVEVTEKLYDEQIITIGQKDQIADAILVLAKSGKFAEAELDKAIASYGIAAPKNIRAQLVELFRSNIVEKFLDVLEKLKIVSVSDRFRQIVESIKTAVLVIANLLDVGAETKQLIEVKS